ncbi:hypothetical protein Pfo_017320 [Paulownia fortunei]|nr:hypothetical protein Pfo_017320 [Paulownia fortunei]
MKGGLIFQFLVLLPSIFLVTNTQVGASRSPSHPPTSSSNAKQQVYIVFLSDEPPEGLHPETYYIKVLSPVLGSEKAAKDALIYSYVIISGFAAKLTPDQASRLKKQPGIVSVNKERKYWLDDHIHA